MAALLQILGVEFLAIEIVGQTGLIVLELFYDYCSAFLYWNSLYLDCPLNGGISFSSTSSKGFNNPVADPIKLFFFTYKELFHFFAAKLGHFIINAFFLYVTNTQTKQQKQENKENYFIGFNNPNKLSFIYLRSGFSN